MIYVITLSAALTLVIQVHFSCQAQIRLLLTEKALVKVLSKYLDYADVFSFNFIIELLKKTSINKNAIELIKDK